MAPPLAKHPKSSARFYRSHPDARREKNKYQRKYNKKPAARKKIQELKRARRRDGNEGKGGHDYSHTSCGTIVRERPSVNRARQGAGKGKRLKPCKKA